MAAAKIRKGDKVVVLSGKDKGKTGEVTGDAQGRQGRRVGRQRRRPPPQADPGQPAGRARAQGSAAARVEGRDRRPQDGKPTRVRFEERGGKKVRVAAKSGELIHG
jgi:large subunit ribosomal protein L24